MQYLIFLCTTLPHLVHRLNRSSEAGEELGGEDAITIGVSGRFAAAAAADDDDDDDDDNDVAVDGSRL